MTEQTVLDIATSTIWVSIQIAAPALLAAFMVGLVISIIQAATQINEQTITFIPKVFVMLLAMLFCGPWIIQKMVSFTVQIFHEIPNFAP